MASSATDEASQFLDSPVLSGVDEASRRAIFRKMIPDRCPAGTVLLSQGKPNDRLWLVVEGSVAIERRRADGHSDLIASLAGPAIFGTTTFFQASAPRASIRATSDLRFWTLDREGHEALRRENPRAAEALAFAIVRVISDRFDLLDVRLADLMSEQREDQRRITELSTFRARLFEEPAL